MLFRSTVIDTAVCYSLVAWGLYEYIERTLPVATTRLLATVTLVYGFPNAITLAWVLSGAGIRAAPQ